MSTTTPTTTTTTTTRDKGDRYGPMEWAQSIGIGGAVQPLQRNRATRQVSRTVEPYQLIVVHNTTSLLEKSHLKSFAMLAR